MIWGKATHTQQLQRKAASPNRLKISSYFLLIAFDSSFHCHIGSNNFGYTLFFFSSLARSLHRHISFVTFFISGFGKLTWTKRQHNVLSDLENDLILFRYHTNNGKHKVIFLGSINRVRDWEKRLNELDKGMNWKPFLRKIGSIICSHLSSLSFYRRRRRLIDFEISHENVNHLSKHISFIHSFLQIYLIH